MIGSMELMEIEGGITAAPGFSAGGIHCGVRKAKKDLALLVSDAPAAVAGVFTMNKVQAAPVIVDRAQLKRSQRCSAVVVNSGNANACTGERGLNDAWAMIRATAVALAIPEDQVLVSSTGVIGQYLPIDRITDGIAMLAQQVGRAGAHDAALAIMTTDTYSKELAIRFTIGDTVATMGAMAKGSGMIAPNMATMLGFVATDVAIAPELLEEALRSATAKSFNRISVDGDTSTNDMVVVLANGLAGNPEITEKGEAYAQFSAALEYLLIRFAKMIARDGEGATKLIEVSVRGAATERDAETAARSIANSNLVKTAIHGEDANWGRIIAAVGYSGIEFDPDIVAITLNDQPVLARNYQIVIDEEKTKAALAREEVTIMVDLNQGEHGVTFWTCDLTKEYVHINASYRS